MRTKLFVVTVFVSLLPNMAMAVTYDMNLNNKPVTAQDIIKAVEENQKEIEAMRVETRNKAQQFNTKNSAEAAELKITLSGCKSGDRECVTAISSASQRNILDKNTFDKDMAAQIAEIDRLEMERAQALALAAGLGALKQVLLDLETANKIQTARIGRIKDYGCSSAEEFDGYPKEIYGAKIKYLPCTELKIGLTFYEPSAKLESRNVLKVVTLKATVKKLSEVAKLVQETSMWNKWINGINYNELSDVVLLYWATLSSDYQMPKYRTVFGSNSDIVRDWEKRQREPFESYIFNN